MLKVENSFSFSNSSTLQIVNCSLVKESLESGEALTKQQIAQMVQLSLPAVSVAVEQMLKTGEIIEKRAGFLGVLKNEKCYILNENHSFKLTIQVDFEKAVFSVCNYGDKKVFRQSKVLPKSQPAIDFFILSIEELFKSYKITSCAMAFPCAVNRGFVYPACGKFSELENINLQAVLQNRFNIPFVLQNAVNAAAFGFSKKNESFLFEKSPLIFAGFEENYPKICTIIEGKILNGFTSFAGNLSSVNKMRFSLSFSSTQKEEFFLELVEYLAAFFNPQIIYFFKSDIIQNIPEDFKTKCTKKLPEIAQPKIELIDDFEYFCDFGLLTVCKNVSRETFLSKVEQTKD